MLKEIELSLVAHKDFITLIFTLALILTSILYTGITYLNVRELRRQSLFQEWVCLRNIFHSSQLALFEFKSKAATANERQGLVIDEIVASIENSIDMAKERITQIEDNLRMQHRHKMK